jgi:hypothetical protein
MSVRCDDPGRSACLAKAGFYIVIDVPDIALPVTSGVSHDVKVRPITPFEEGDHCTPESIIAGEIDLFQITDLGLAGQGYHVP